MLALATGSVGLVAIAMLFMLVTPSRHAQPVAVIATTTPDADSSATIVAARRTIAESEADTDGSRATPAALATPIGAGQYAVVLRESLAAATGGALAVVLPSGRLTSGNVMEGDDDGRGDTVLVHLDDHEPGHPVARHRPHDRDVVTVMTDPPITVTLADLDQVDVEDGTAVVDAEGQLVGLCAERRGGGTRLAEVPADADDATAP